VENNNTIEEHYVPSLKGVGKHDIPETIMSICPSRQLQSILHRRHERETQSMAVMAMHIQALKRKC
jgi:hypothetical protein